jgi:hypothetical protein
MDKNIFWCFLSVICKEGWWENLKASLKCFLLNSEKRIWNVMYYIKMYAANKDSSDLKSHINRFNNTKRKRSFVEELITCFPLIRHWPYGRKWPVRRYFYCCVCIRCSRIVFTKPLPNNGSGANIQKHRLMRRIYDVRRWDGLRCHNIHTKFNKDWFRHLKVDRKGYTGSQRAWWRHKPDFVL